MNFPTPQYTDEAVFVGVVPWIRYQIEVEHTSVRVRACTIPPKLKTENVICNMVENMSIEIANVFDGISESGLIDEHQPNPESGCAFQNVRRQQIGRKMKIRNDVTCELKEQLNFQKSLTKLK